MTETAPNRPFKRPGPRQIVWLIITAMCIISLIFSVLAAQNYTEVTKASILSYVVTEENATLTYDTAGNLESVNMSLDFTIVNPSMKELKTWIFVYKGWVRDLPLENGIDTSRQRVDGTIYKNGSEQSYYPVFRASFSFENPSYIVPARSNLTLTCYIILNQSNYPEIFGNLEEIYNYSASVGHELEWMHYTSSFLYIRDVPPFAGPDNTANLVRKFEGTDITPGGGGAGP